ncbi:MAG: chemotaxis protein CheX [Betaproteobacteria bacterium]|nr:chemotaxis protein CheX [Betaproteobacteria bacterium]
MNTIAPGPIVTEAVTKVLSTQFGMQAEASTQAAPKLQGYTSHLLGTVSITGSRVRGDLYLSMPDPLADKLVARMLGGAEDNEATLADKVDVAGEICNMLAGQIGAALSRSGYANDLSIPEVSHNSDTWTEPLAEHADYHAVWQCAGLPLVLNLALRLEPL